MPTINPITSTAAGVAAPATNAASGGDVVPNANGNVMLLLANTSGGSITVTVTPAATVRPADGFYPAMPIPPVAVAVPAGERRLIGPFAKAQNNANRELALTYSSHTGLTITPLIAGV